MDHLVTTVSDHFVISWWWVIPALIGATIGMSLTSRDNGRVVVGGFLMSVFSGFALAMVVLTQMTAHSVSVDEHHPSVTRIAHGLGLRDMPGQDTNSDDSTKTFIGKDGTRYSQCYVETSKVDAHHVSSRLLCASNGRSVAVHRQS